MVSSLSFVHFGQVYYSCVYIVHFTLHNRRCGPSLCATQMQLMLAFCSFRILVKLPLRAAVRDFRLCLRENLLLFFLHQTRCAAITFCQSTPCACFHYLLWLAWPCIEGVTKIVRLQACGTAVYVSTYKPYTT